MTNTNPASTLAGCPFCGGHEVHIESYDSGGSDWDTFTVICRCGSEGAVKSNSVSATDAWNRRAHPLPVQVEERQPLTEASIELGREEYGGERFDFTAGVRFAERAHGIGSAGTDGGANSHE